jgi:hypothetical protein
MTIQKLLVAILFIQFRCWLFSIVAAHLGDPGLKSQPLNRLHEESEGLLSLSKQI